MAKAGDATQPAASASDPAAVPPAGPSPVSAPVSPAIALAGTAPEPLVAQADPSSADRPAELIEPGRALALADFTPPALGAGERLIRLAYRMGIPGQMLTAPFRKPARTRLLAAPVNPIPGNRIAGTALRAGHFLVHGCKLPIAQADFGGAGRLPPPIDRYVHGFDWLADLEASARREQVTQTAERILAAWFAANPAVPSRPGKGPAWSVANTGHRLLNWLMHAPLLLSSPEKAPRNQLLTAMNGTARWLDRNVTRGEDLLAQVAGWTALVAAGLLLPDGRPRRLFAEAGLIEALGELVGDDGGLLSRSPLGQMEAIALLVRLSACYASVRREPPAQLQSVLTLLVPPLLALTHGDGTLSAWQGGWAVAADEVSGLVAASGVRTRPLRDVRQWGYQRVNSGKSLLLLDAAPPPLARHARNGCASTLAFEFSHGGHRLVVNCGGAAAAGGLMPARLEQGLRATAAHSTLVLDDANSTAVLINGGLGTGVTQVELDRRTFGNDTGSRSGFGATRLEASHDGYVSRFGLTHRRILILRDDGTELRGEDLLVPTKGKGKRGKVGFAIRFHLGAGIEVGLSDDRMGAGIAMPDGSYWQFRVGDAEVAIEDSIWADGEGHPVATQQIVIQGMVSRGGGSFSWLLKKMG